MILPKAIEIGAITYSVRVKEDLRSDNGVRLFGQIVYADCEILIDEKYVDGQRLPFSVWHEVIHGILEQAGMSNVKEKVVEVLGYGIVDALRKNESLRMNEEKKI
jgi:hypothetical protein